MFKIKEKGNLLIRLHFYGFESLNFKFNAQFHVSANDHELLYNYTAENTQNPRIKDYMIWIDTGKVVVRFTPSENTKVAFINAIEVISAPKDLIADVAQFVDFGKNEKMNGLIRNAFETVYRVNIGGPKVTPFNDSLWRTWLPDNEFLKSSDGSKCVYFGGRIKYQLGGASREVGPDNVYNTARVITSSNNSIPELNMTWVFAVKEGYKYLIRLHFCDIASIALGELYFNVYANGNLAYENLDLTTITNGMLGSPFYADFVVDEENSGILTVEVGPSNMSLVNAVDGILNGIEIMKMNDSSGSLDGRVSAVSIVNTRARGNIGVLIPFVAAVSLLITAYMTMQRRRVGIKDSVAWSPVPVDSSEVDFKHGNHLTLNKV